MGFKSETIQISDFGLGDLYRQDPAELIPYQPFEVSRHQIGILSLSALHMGEQVSLHLPFGKRVGFRVLSCEASRHQRQLGIYRSSLLCLDEGLDLGLVTQSTGCAKKMELSSGLRLQQMRFSPRPPIKMSANTFGSPQSFDFVLKNMSQTGCMLQAIGGVYCPFQDHTLIEFTMSEKGSWVEAPIKGIGKVVWCDKDLGGRSESGVFGVQFLPFEEPYEQRFSEVIQIIGEAAYQYKQF